MKNRIFSFRCFVVSRDGSCKALIEIKNSKFKTTNDGAIPSNRISVKIRWQTWLIGYKKESAKALFLADADFSSFSNLKQLPDRSYIPNHNFSWSTNS